MSWETYIESLKMPNEKGIVFVEEAVIWGTEPPLTPWTHSGGLTDVTEEEVKILLGDRSNFPSNGLVIGGMNCVLIRDELDVESVFSIQLKTKKCGGVDGMYPICVAKGKKTLIIAKGPKDSVAVALAAQVYKTLEHLRNSDF